jgi:glutathione S-transferase
MSLVLYAHPFSSYCQKVLIALYENDVPFEYRELGPADPGAMDELKARWPFARFPLLVDGGRTRWLPADPAEALDVRFLDRFFDQHVMTPMQAPVAESIRARADRQDEATAEAARLLDLAYGWLEQRLDGRQWAAGDAVSLADCAAAPSLFYADWVRPIGDAFPAVRAYRRRLLAWPAFARAVEEARPHRHLFPLGAPDRD